MLQWPAWEEVVEEAKQERGEGGLQGFFSGFKTAFEKCLQEEMSPEEQQINLLEQLQSSSGKWVVEVEGK